MKHHDSSCTVLPDSWQEPSFANGSMLAQASRRTPLEKGAAWLFVSGADRVLSSKPVQITIREEDGLYFAECERLHVYADGLSRDEAIDCLHEQVVLFFKRYSGLSENDVIGSAVGLRKLYVENFALSSSV